MMTKTDIKTNDILKKCFSEHRFYFTILFSVFVLIFMSVIISSWEMGLQNQREKMYGSHNGAILCASENEITRIQEHASIHSMGIMKVCGMIYDNTDEPIGSIGVASDSLKEMESFAFLEGNWPRNEDQIVVESVLLDQLHLPYEIGQKISLHLVSADEDKNEPDSTDNKQSKNKEYTISGILNTYSINWKSDGESFCTAFVSDPICEEWKEINHVFFCSDHSSEMEMNEMIPLLDQDSESRLLYNDYAFLDKVNSVLSYIKNQSAYILFTLVILFFLFCQQLSIYKINANKIRVLKILGIHEKQMYRSFLLNGLMGWLKGMIGGSILGTIGARIVVFILENQQPDFFEWNVFLNDYLKTGLLTLGMTISLKILQLLIYKNLDILTHSNNMAPYDIQRKSDYCKKRKNIKKYKDFIIRERSLKKRYHYTEAALCAIMFIGLSLSIFITGKEIRNYRCDNIINGSSYVWQNSFSRDDGLDNKQIARIRNTAGIKKVIYYNELRSDEEKTDFVLSWDGMDRDGYVANLKKSLFLMPEQELKVGITVLPEDSPIWEYYMSLSDNNEVKIDDFRDGKGIIVYQPHLNEQSYDEGTGYEAIDAFGIYQSDMQKIYKSSLKPGDTVMLSVKHDKTFSFEKLKVLSVMEKYDSYFQTELDWLVPGDIIISEQLYGRIVRGRDDLYNHVMVYCDQNSSYEITDKVMSSIKCHGTVEFVNTRQDQSNKQSKLINKVLMIFSIITGICLVVSFLIYRLRILSNLSYSYHRKILKQIGCSQKILGQIEKNKMMVPVYFVIIFVNVAIWVGQAYRYNYKLKDGVIYYLFQFPWQLYVIEITVSIIMYFFIVKYSVRVIKEIDNN